MLPQGSEDGLHLLGVHGDLTEGGRNERGRVVTKVAVEKDQGSGNIIDVTLAAVCSLRPVVATSSCVLSEFALRLGAK